MIANWDNFEPGQSDQIAELVNFVQKNWVHCKEVFDETSENVASLALKGSAAVTKAGKVCAYVQVTLDTHADLVRAVMDKHQKLLGDHVKECAEKPTIKQFSAKLDGGIRREDIKELYNTYVKHSDSVQFYSAVTTWNKFHGFDEPIVRKFLDPEKASPSQETHDAFTGYRNKVGNLTIIQASQRDLRAGEERASLLSQVKTTCSQNGITLHSSLSYLTEG